MIPQYLTALVLGARAVALALACCALSVGSATADPPPSGTRMAQPVSDAPERPPEFVAWIAAFRVDAWITAGKALRKAGRYQFALEHLQHGLDRDPNNLDIHREMGICLQRLALAGTAGHSLERARQHYRAALDIFPRDSEIWALLGRVDKDAWTAAWDRR